MIKKIGMRWLQFRRLEKNIVFFADYIILLCLPFSPPMQKDSNIYKKQNPNQTHRVCPKKSHGNITGNVYLYRCYWRERVFTKRLTPSCVSQELNLIRGRPLFTWVNFNDFSFPPSRHGEMSWCLSRPPSPTLISHENVSKCVFLV